MKTQTKTTNVRELALDILLQIEKNQAYSNLLLNQSIKRSQIQQKDIGLLTEIVYGTIQRKLTLDYFLKPFLKNPHKVQEWVIVLLRSTIYQMHYLTRIPDHAAIFEAVEIAKKRGHKGIASMVNGVLRSMQREGTPSFDSIMDPVERLSIEMSFPLWLVQRWTNQYGFEQTKLLCESTMKSPTSTARVNMVRITKEELLAKLEEEGVIGNPGDLAEDAIKVEKGNLALSNSFKEGFLTVQDESSMLVAKALDPKPGEYVLDSCAAPGGKTTHIAEMMNNSGQVVSVDLHEHKVKLIDEQVKRLHLSNVETVAMDSRKLKEKFEEETFDRILVDAPCSGLGVIRRKPDIKYQKKEQDIHHLSTIQSTILSSVAPLLKKGGTLVYSTCTMDKEENEEVVKKFLIDHTDYELDVEFINRLPQKIREQAEIKDGRIQILPHHFGTDGFFISCLRKRV
ncbi:16S rRNA (cytosine(967)-C(5))-methyltransferase RsmB [Bacillus suaedaesalsae]|uniref:16S rRNA (cytosine(967)-C(5))-methyltransferase n=1 Tax=Bacillus suaedaesalsae TaxID=2810349 RepID=A0ABS2DJD4_9BACI|nr:16S rRNA (cytosine(967)-C(5))-methyltransferase RsmB [Bacillus suaedaesalsae]MBM6618496.1 16S rRNA (cytosine(967)-C(5))-methyltransferase RsmB [Bacillus suaedaesalsae]